MSSLFKGLAEFYGKGSSQYGNGLRSGEVFIAQVLEVLKDSTVDGNANFLEKNPTAAGVIKINRANRKVTTENEVALIAEPLDRNHYRLPVIGEQVLVTQQNAKYYYFSVVTSLVNLLVNVDSGLMLNTAQSSGNTSILADTDQERKRFESRLEMSSTLFESKTQLPSRVREGDTILEGRLGGVIKFTQTISKEGVWDKEKQITNIGTSYDGDPMLVLKSNVRQKSYDDLDIVNPPLQGLEDDDINEENSSVYLTTTQNIPMRLASSLKLFSWTADMITAESSVLKDPDTAVLSSLIPDAYDPNDEVQVIVEGGSIAFAGSGVGGGGEGLGDIQGGTWQQTAANFIAKKEGFTAVGTWDVNHYRAGYGSDKIYKNGVLTVVTQGMQVTKEEALVTLRDYSIPKYASQIARDLGQSKWDGLSDNQKAALTSLGYNVGAYFISARSYGKKIKLFVDAGDLQGAGQTIYTDGPKTAGGQLLAGLEKRRREESQLFLT